MRMMLPAAVAVLCVAGACSSDTGGGDQPKASATDAAATDAGATDEGAMADLQASAVWREPRCRWLKSGTWIAAYPQERAVYQAAADLGLIEMREAGQINRTGNPEPAWNIKVTDAGKAEAATCSPATPPNFGVPVSRRQFVSAKRLEVNFAGDTPFEVEFIWVPTSVGDRVRHELTGNMAVEQGPAQARASMRRARVTTPGANGWAVLRLDDMPRAR